MSTMFELYTKEVEIAGQKYKFRPLSGRYIGKLYKLTMAMSKARDEASAENPGASDEVLNKETMVRFMTEENVLNLHTLSCEMVKASYPDQDPQHVDEWVSQNLLEMLGPLNEVNMGKLNALSSGQSE